MDLLRAKWEQLTESTVAAMRAHVGPDVDDPCLIEPVGEQSLRSLERIREG
jgi:hypothetical protein